MKFKLFFLFVSLSFTCAASAENSISEKLIIEWLPDVLRATKMVIADCRNNLSINQVETLLVCVQARALRAMDRLIQRDTVDLPYGVKLIKNHKMAERELNARSEPPFQAPSSVDMINATLTRAARFLRTHSLHIPLPRNVSFDIFEGRRRRPHKNDMMGLLLFGVMAMSVIAIPMGFQFLAVLGGKALMLAKLALILTSIQGLKKIATSNFSYGLYQAPVHSRPWMYDRRWQPPAGGEQSGLFDAFDTPEPHALDAIRPRISLPRVRFGDNGMETNVGVE